MKVKSALETLGSGFLVSKQCLFNMDLKVNKQHQSPQTQLASFSVLDEITKTQLF